RLPGQVAILDGQAEVVRARTVESERAGGRIATADGAGQSRQCKEGGDRKYRDEDDSPHAHDESPTPDVTPTPRSGERRWRADFEGGPPSILPAHGRQRRALA